MIVNVQSQPEVDVSLVVCTFNRSSDLEELLSTAVTQQTGSRFNFEILVVDNNSTDNTRIVVEKFIQQGHDNLRYVFESKQGKSNALNTALNYLRGRIYIIADDDFVLPGNWVNSILHAFEKFPDVSFVSGKVLPLWQKKPPTWLSKSHWSAIAMADYGDELFYADLSNQICLLACSFRTKDVIDVGGYRTELGVTSNQVGGTEDLELLQRLWQSGRKGVYLPHIWFYHKVTRNRCTKKYHRYWHTGHGAFYAAMRDVDFERSRFRFFDVPSHLYGQAVRDFARMVKQVLTGNFDSAFAFEVRLWFFWGFWKKRYRDGVKSGELKPVREVLSIHKILSPRRTKPSA